MVFAQDHVCVRLHPVAFAHWRSAGGCMRSGCPGGPHAPRFSTAWAQQAARCVRDNPPARVNCAAVGICREMAVCIATFPGHSRRVSRVNGTGSCLRHARTFGQKSGCKHACVPMSSRAHFGSLNGKGVICSARNRVALPHQKTGLPGFRHDLKVPWMDRDARMRGELLCQAHRISVQRMCCL